MASLLLWWSPSGAPIDDTIWRRMVARVGLDAGLPIPPDALAQGPGFRALALRTLRIEPAPLRHIAPDTLLLAALRHEASETELMGRRLTEPGAVIRLNPSARSLSVTRDLLGHRHLVWARLPEGVLVATREEPLLVHPGVSRTLDELHIASMLALAIPDDTSTPFAGIHAVAAGMTVEFTPTGIRTLREPFEPCDDLAGWSDARLSERFRGLLEDSIHRAASGASRVGFSISSGLDAASIAALYMPGFRGARRPLAVCYGYSVAEGADIDERGPAQQLCARLGIEFDPIDLGAVRLGFTLDHGRTVPIGSVLENPYREFKTEVYKRLAAHGVDVTLAGHGADQFAMTPANWLWSAWADRRWDWMQAGMRKYLVDRGWTGTLQHPSLRRFARYMLFGRRGLMSVRAPKSMPAAFHQAWRETRQAALSRFAAWPDPIRADMHFNSLEAMDYALEVPVAEGHGLDIRCPFRDWNLVRFVLSVPTFLMAGPIGYKWMQKQAVATCLSSEWIEREKGGDLSPLWNRDFERRRTEILGRIRDRRSAINRVTRALDDNQSLDILGRDRLTQLAQLSAWLDCALGSG